MSECDRILGLSRTGEHKPAVDAGDRLKNAGKDCSNRIQSRIEISRKRLGKADAYLHKALQRKKEGNLLSAQANLEMALSVYPKYYWAQKLLHDVRRCIVNEVSSLKNEASYLESRGDLPGAVARLQEASQLSPGDEELRSGIIRLQAAVEQSRKFSRIQGTIEKINRLVKTGRLEEAEKVLLEKNSSGALGKEGEDLLRQVRDLKSVLITQRMTVAIEAEQKGDLKVAAGHLSYVLTLVSEKTSRAAQAVEFARLLGMKLYSAGELSMAHDLWVLALRKDPGNDKIQKYIEEVDLRLEKLEELKIEENERSRQ